LPGNFTGRYRDYLTVEGKATPALLISAGGRSFTIKIPNSI
jgi:hypothetical protein